MPSSSGKLSFQNLAGPIQSLVFFILYYLYLWLDVEPRLIYHGAGMISNFPVFFKDWAFFQHFITYPGGILEYLSALLSQFFYYSWAGALILTVQAWLICVCTNAFIKTINISGLRWLSFMLPTLLLIPYTQYTYCFAITTSLSAALLFVCLYLKVTPKSNFAALVVLLVLSLILYYIAGAAYLLFAVLCAIYELLFRRRRQIALACLLSGIVIPYVAGVLVFSVSIFDAFGKLTPFHWMVPRSARLKMRVIFYILYLFLPLSVPVLGLWLIFVKKVGLLLNSKFKIIRNTVSWYCGLWSLRWAVESVFVFALAGAAIFYFHDSARKTSFEVDYYACHRMWPQVLSSARGNPGDYFVRHEVDRALYHTGRLAEEMFAFPQDVFALLLTSKEYAFPQWHNFDTYFDLGLMNTAEHSLTESMMVLGERPLILKRLALINMAKAEYGAAGIYLGALGKTLFDDDWANDYLDRLESDPDLSKDKHIQRLQALTLSKHDNIVSSVETMLSDLLAENRQNKMAFEYLMAWYLLSRQLDKFINNLDRLDDFDYPRIPRHYEEAILIYMSGMKKAVDLHGRQISLESRRRLEGFNQVVQGYGGNQKAAFSELAKYYSDSYFFYLFYGRSGVGIEK